MNLIAINGSPHGEKGTTGMLLSEVVRAAQEDGASVTVVQLGDYTVGPCRACDACHRTGQCPLPDDFASIRDAMLAADGVILASPNYLVSVTAQLKALMDRCCGPLHCLAFRGKYSAAVVTSGGGGCAEVENYMLGFLRHLGSWTVGSVGATGAQLANPAGRTRAMQSAADLGKAITIAIRQRRTYADQIPQQDEFAVLMKQLVQFRREQWTHEYEYWKSKGWL